MTFYQNSVGSPYENMMILPVPNIDSLELHNVKYKKMFDHLRASVTKVPERSIEFRHDFSVLRSSASYEPLPVIEHGSYLVSIATTLDDLFRLDTTVFHFSRELYTFFAKHYTAEFGYLCCKLKEGKQDYEPICYSHRLHSNGRLFVPTLHYHNHGGHIDTTHADWDHLIYSVGTTVDANHKFLSNEENKMAWIKFPQEYRRDGEVPVRCAEITGNEFNRDIAFLLA
jgi:hypothetical protein